MASGIIGGPPCPDFSKALRGEPSGYGVEMLSEYTRLVTTVCPDWFLMENVPGVPDIIVPGYTVQRFNLNASECGIAQNRLRCFQFGQLALRPFRPLVIHRGSPMPATSPCCLASEGRSPRRGWKEFCALQGLPESFDLPGLSREAKYRAVGNGVPIPMARVVATAIKAWSVTTEISRVCVCQCGREVQAGRTLATPACRKRMQRKRDAAIVTSPGMVTASASLQNHFNIFAPQATSAAPSA